MTAQNQRAYYALEETQSQQTIFPEGQCPTSHLLLMYGLKRLPYAEKDDPQPQECVALGLMKLNPCRISVSS